MSDDANLLLPLVLAGAALAGIGVMRMTTPALARMPRAIALAAIVAGIGVASTGFVLRSGPSPPATRPRATLEPVPPSHASEIVAVTGTVRDAGREPLRAVEVTLRTFDRTELVDERTTITDADGAFAFREVERSATTAFVASTVHTDVTFSSGLLLPGPHGIGPVELVVARPTEDASVIVVDVDSTVLVGDAEGIQAVHILSLRNTSEDAFVAGVRLPLLPGATGFVPREGLDRTKLAVADDELTSFAPLLPGTTEVVYEYGIPAARPVAVERELAYGTRRLDVLVAGDVRLDAPDLRRAGRVRLGATGTRRDYDRFTTADLEPGDTLAMRASVPSPRTARIALIAGGVALALLILVVPLVRRRRAPRAAAVAAEP